MEKRTQCKFCGFYRSGICTSKNKAVIGDRFRLCSSFKRTRKKIKESSVDDFLDYRSTNVSYSDMNTLS